MRVHHVSAWQKAAALLPMALLAGAWGVAVGSGSLATASEDVHDVAIPEVPATAFDRPASLQTAPTGVDPRAGAVGTISTLSTSGIPTAALTAYHRAETLLARADASCRLPWSLVAAIGRVESNHGRAHGSSLDDDGVATPPIYGVALDGSAGHARITDTDDGALDKDTRFDRAVGPMQFIPGTWQSVAVDADADTKSNPQDIDDAATAAGVYLCAGDDDLGTTAGAATAVKRYNHSDSYVRLVLDVARAYAAGQFSQTPDGQSSSTILTAKSEDQTLTPKQRTKAAADQKEAAAQPSPGTGTGGSNGGTTSPTPGTGTPDDGGGTGSGGGTLGGALDDVTSGTPLEPITDPVTGLLSEVEARLRCTLLYPLGPSSSVEACVDDLTS